jgi:hypothetical protein
MASKLAMNSAIAAVAMLSGLGCSDSEPTTYSVSGHVVLHGTLRDFAGGILGERVVTDADDIPLWLTRSGVIAYSTTSISGQYQFSEVEPGSYRVVSSIASATADTTEEMIVASGDLVVPDTLKLGTSGDIMALPNPFHGGVSAVFHISSPDTIVDIWIADISGISVRKLWHHVVPLGKQWIAWDGLYDNHSEVPDGAYWFIMSQGAQRRADLAFKDQ